MSAWDGHPFDDFDSGNDHHAAPDYSDHHTPTSPDVLHDYGSSDVDDGSWTGGPGSTPDDGYSDPSGGDSGLHGEGHADDQYWQPQSENGFCVPMSVADVVGEMTGHQPSEQEVVQTAVDSGVLHGSPGAWTGTDEAGAVSLLDHYGIAAHNEHGDIKSLEGYLDQGRAVILAVDSSEIWDGVSDDGTPGDHGADHAVRIVGIDESRGVAILEDSGTPDGRGEEVPLSILEDAWGDSHNSMIVTDGTAHADMNYDGPDPSWTDPTSNPYGGDTPMPPGADPFNPGGDPSSPPMPTSMPMGPGGMPMPTSMPMGPGGGMPPMGPGGGMPPTTMPPGAGGGLPPGFGPSPTTPTTDSVGIITGPNGEQIPTTPDMDQYFPDHDNPFNQDPTQPDNTDGEHGGAPINDGDPTQPAQQPAADLHVARGTGGDADIQGDDDGGSGWVTAGAVILPVTLSLAGGVWSVKRGGGKLPWKR